MAGSRKKPRPSSERRQLVLQIAGSLSDPKRRSESRWFPNRISTSDQFDLIIITNLWRKIPRKDRAEMALEIANEVNAEVDGGAKIGGHIYTASALTFDEAISLGYLPYRIEPATEGLDEAARSKVDRAFQREGPIETVDGPQLRFETLEGVREAYRRLSEEVPGPHWIIYEEIMVEA